MTKAYQDYTLRSRLFLLKTMNTEKETAAKFLKWVLDIKSLGASRSRKNELRPELVAECKTFCREHWNRYGFLIIKKALNHTACTSLSNFQGLCREFKDLINKKS